MRTFCLSLRVSIVAAALVLAVSLITFGGGGATPNAPAASPAKPDRQTKVWTNEDVQALGPGSLSPPSETASSAAQLQTAPAAAAQPGAVRTAEIPPEQNPVWYARQVNALSSQLASITAQKDSLQNFISAGAGLQPGLNIAAPAVVINTHDLVEQLEAAQQEIEQRLDALADTARQNNISPEVLIPGAIGTETPREARTNLLDEYDRLTEQLAQSAETVAFMESDTAAKNMTLLQPDPRWGGNETTSFLQDIYNQQDALQTQLRSTDDSLRHEGLNPQ